MNFKFKNAVFRLIEIIPRGNDLYYFAQKRITHSLGTEYTRESFENKYKQKVLKHVEELEAYGYTDFANKTYYEFGAGWDLFASIGFSLLGMRSLELIDINELVRDEQISATCYAYNEFGKEFGISNINVKVIINNSNYREWLQENFRINYRAPFDARETGLADNSIDLMISNVTMEHIPLESLKAILKECYRILKPGAMISVGINYEDHWAFTDNSISIYNYLQYEEQQWQRYNPGLHYQNRLRHCDYEKLFYDAGFEILVNKPDEIKDEDRAALKKIYVASCFNKYSTDELLVRTGYFLLKKNN